MGWFGCVYFGTQDWGVASLIFPLIAWVLLKLAFELNRTSLFRLFVLLVVGLTFDSIAMYSGLIEILQPTLDGFLPINDVLPINGFLPMWLISLWLLFIASLPLLHSLFRKKYFLAAILGAIFGPLSYRGGTQFGILTMNGSTAIIIYAIFWAVYIPLAVFWLSPKEIQNEN